MSALSLDTTITRAGPAGGRAVVCDVRVHFAAAVVAPARAPTFAGPFAEPGWPAELEFTFLGADFPGGEAEDAPGELTAAESARLEAWLTVNYDLAAEEAEGRVEGAGP